MTRASVSSRSDPRGARLLVAAAFLGSLWGWTTPQAEPQPVAQSGCEPVEGTFSNVFLTGAEACPSSPIATCTQGQLSGALSGAYAFTFLTTEPVGDGGAAVSRFTGTSVVTLAGGTFTGDDFGVLRTQAFPVADFTTHLKIASGTGDFEGATGQLTIQGTASFITGLGSGTYRGFLCVPR
jgi:hypothetical protein